MVKMEVESRIEIWSSYYINHLEERAPDDRDVNIIQIEPGNENGDYMVEVQDNG